MSRLACHAPTKAYIARRMAEGKTKREAIRILKRYVAREVYRYLPRG
jgi:transposase